jgi:hypothetical protein
MYTEITKGNISYCKELMTMIDELRYLDGIKGTVLRVAKSFLLCVSLWGSKHFNM